MSEFKASNGWYIDEDGVLREANGRCVGYGGDVDRLREFFQELRDHELGRWRDPEYPDVVCYSRGRDYVRVVSEKSGQHWEFWRGDLMGTSTAEVVASKYFIAHPEHKPWHDAEPGEGWALRVLDGPEQLHSVDGAGVFHDAFNALSPLEGDITHGRRVWPEDES